ncbi:hypothetical protein [Rhodococcus sp. SORGH_AS_0303]|uniref:hypothetical protein n=1 Tax=Rhodococcus sp. SORGH_AS_0303 TaxID=3041753 RepID=UPI002785DFA1|nr:hypothetical protein [Rhodococcus sp. SORGH_AS_0303]MDQ1202843.1 hypothetical protein [Rhodococcus sp. SORGH_AS_0303]
MTTPTDGTLDDGTAEGDTASAVPTLDEFRQYVGGDPEQDAVLVRDLEEAVAHVDAFCAHPDRPIPAVILRKWYLKVGAEIFDSSQGPISVNDRFGTPAQVRSSRDPIHVILREARHYVGYF